VLGVERDRASRAPDKVGGVRADYHCGLLISHSFGPFGFSASENSNFLGAKAINHPAAQLWTQ
jgi:hypothetical protein